MNPVNGDVLQEQAEKLHRLLTCLKDLNSSGLYNLLNENVINVNDIYADYGNLNAFQILCDMYLNNEDNYDCVNFRDRRKKYLIECVKVLLEKGTDLRYKDSTEMSSAMHYSLLTWNLDVIKIVLKQYEKEHISITNKDLLTSVIYLFAHVIRDGQDSEDEYSDYDDDSQHDDSQHHLNCDNKSEEESNEDYKTCEEIIKLLLEHNVDVNTLDEDSGVPPIYLAACFKLKGIADILLQNNIENIDLDYYVDEDNETARNLIIKHKWYVDVLPDKTNCSHHLLYKYIFQKNIRAFINEYCKDKELKDSIDKIKKCSFLFRAVQQGADEIVSYMLRETEDDEIEDLECMLRIACTKGFYNIVKILLRDYNIPYDLNLIQFLIENGKKGSDKNNAVDYNECLEQLLKGKTIVWNYINLNKIDKQKTILQYAIEHKQIKMIQILLRNGASLLINNEENSCLALDIDSQVLQNHFDDCISRQEEESTLLTLSKNKRRTNKNKSDQYNYSINFNSILSPRKANNENLSEMKVFDQLSNDPDYKDVLTHPFSQIFIAMKWHKLRMFFYFDAIFYLMYAMYLTFYIFIPNFPLYIIICVFTVISIVWEFLQVLVFSSDYFRAFESWLKIILLILCVVMIVLCGMGYNNHTIFTQINACVILTSFANFFFLMGHLPFVPSTVVTSIIMLKTVYFTFIPSFITYLPLILAFIISFYALFPDSEHFKNFWTSMYKVILMATGEFDTNDLNLDEFPVGYIIILIFVLFIAIGLFNLLTGLAVSDIQNIKDNAELYELQIRIIQITRMEKIIFKHKLVNFFPCLKSVCLFSNKNLRRMVKIDKHVVKFLIREPKSKKLGFKNNVDLKKPKEITIPLRNKVLNSLETKRKLFIRDFT